MATTSVKDVGSVMNLSAAMSNMAAGAAKSVQGDFQSVFNSQSASQDASGKDTRPAKEIADKAKPGEDLRAKKQASREVKKPEERRAKGKEDLSDEDIEKASEAVSTAVNDLIAQIAETFDMSVEEVEGIMADMDLQPADLLNPENLSNLLLEAGGAVDSLSLLTNEQLYGDYQMLMEEGRKLTEALSEELGIAPGELEKMLQTQPEEVTEAMPKEAEEQTDIIDEKAPKIEITGAENAAKPEETQGSAVRTEGRNAGGNRHEGHAENGAEHGNLVLETIKDQAFDPQMAEVQAAADTRAADTQDIMRQIMDYMRVSVKPDMSNLEMQLHPASLGSLQIQVASKGGVLTANFVTQNEAVKAALESQMVQLKESFEQQGMKVEAIEVTVQTHQFEENLEQGRGRQPEEPGEGRRSRTRRINLGGIDDAGLPEELDAEDRIAAEMLQANGGTVDFTA